MQKYIINTQVNEHFEKYPDDARGQLKVLRSLIYEIAAELKLGDVQESLKWGEPSYSVRTGSPFRLDWKAKSPNHYYLFFHCQTKLVDTFRQLYSETLIFQGNRAIVLSLFEPLPKVAIKHCLEIALTYKKRKGLPLLGV